MYQASSSSTSRRILVVLALLLFIVALVLVIVQSFTDGKIGSRIIGTYGQGYSDGFNTAREMATSIGLTTRRSITTIVGTVTGVSSDSVTIETSGLFLDEHVDGIGSMRMIFIDGDTEIVKSTKRDISTVADELEIFDSALSGFDPNSEAETPEPPSFYEETDIAISDIEVGDVIRVSGMDDEDLLLIETFTASKITKTEIAVGVLDENLVTDEDLTDVEEIE
jgi:hypothetical protein